MARYFYTQLDALSPAVDVLMKDLPGAESSPEELLAVLKAAVEVYYRI